MDRYKLEGKKVVICADEKEWLEWLETMKEVIVHVDKTEKGKVMVSTVFLRIDHSFGSGPPLLFETMIFGGKHDG